ncbi:SIR2 family protein [Conexibacter stalactiti]|uniref:SIR2 family protein n=1 Tax=Conexibacter stalactiti TaxID=1940611 RepID=A0ABU4HT43_9ACTN|nr:SIR2 family protein [Conexibacter stalactiti]MDW5595934.1 SIR2 family protein [Conexibacter stalactiti]MEC5036576.1 SIR2 family protein [Conexibacter stalactiti]
MGFDTQQDAYRALRAIVAERTRPILAFVGSGASAEAGLPTWAGLRSALVEALLEKAEGLDAPGNRKTRGLAGRAAAEDNLWLAFELLRNGLGRTTFRELIREQFQDVHRVDPPEVYGRLWELGIKGMLTLNLDRLAVRSLTDTLPSMTHIEHSGEAVYRLRSNLTGPRPFVGNLHGMLEDTDTWVFTQTQLANLKAKPQYQSFFDSVFSQFVVIFVGISVEDVAVGGHLERLAGLDMELPVHFWISHRKNLQIDRWAEDVGVRMIRYTADGHDHSELGELFHDLAAFVSRDSPDVPRIHLEAPPTRDIVALPPQEEVLTWNAREIRSTLNGHAVELLSVETPESYAAYDEFSSNYDEAIYRAWYTTDKPPNNELLGYVLKERAARGAFGVVYRALARDGRQVAIKVLLDEVRQDPDALQSFRRGVRSMRILERHNVDGMGRYLDASEIPAFVVMDWIDGPNLAEAKESGMLNDWQAVLEIAARLVSIIRTAHSLPERVLHRDIRPSNVMLRGFWNDPDDYEVIVLDFDLSWHKGAAEKSVLHTTSLGYLAPEQLRPVPGSSTRSALVDSFGLGMTLLYLCTGAEPFTDQHRHRDWQDEVRNACEELPAVEWRSLPSRAARLIIRATQEQQSSRLDLAEMYRELSLLGSTLTSPATLRAPELVTEELAARSEIMNQYRWSEDNAEAIRDAGTGLRLALRADLTNDLIELTVRHDNTGVEERGRVGKYISRNARSLGEQLAASGWKIRDSAIGQGSVSIRATILARTIAQDVTRAAELLDRGLGRLVYERNR